MSITQFFYKNPKFVGLVEGTPKYTALDNFKSSEETIRIASYSKNGEFFGYSDPNFVYIHSAKSGELINKLEISDVHDLEFSPQGSYLMIWQKPARFTDANGNIDWNKNVKIFDLSNNCVIVEFIAKIQSSWKPQFTSDEKVLAKLFTNQIRFYELGDGKAINLDKPSFILKQDDISTYLISPGKNPAIAVFVPEKSGKPASVKVYNISLNGFNQSLCSKNFFKAERCVFKWNALGTAVLALASTDVDSSNQSYYGETALYLLGIAGSYNARIALDKEGPIHDFNWSPSSREFGVVYGFMPSKTSFFDARGNCIYSLPLSSRNTLLFSPHAKFVLVAGFGNLQGTVDIYDRTNKFAKVASFEASNTSVCEWSPCGRYILTATTAPRLRVDNGIKIWHASGKLVYVSEYKELNLVNWRPQAVTEFPMIKSLEKDVTVDKSVAAYLQKNKKSSSDSDGTAAPKKRGAYVPPHARRNGATSSVSNSAPRSLYEKEMADKNRGIATQRIRIVPGAVPVEPQVESKAASKNRRKKEARRAAKETSEESESVSSSSSIKETTVSSSSETSGVIGGVVSFEEKKIRSLLKKLRAIEVLKMKQANGDRLENTQVLKIGTEDKVREELESLGWKDE